MRTSNLIALIEKAVPIRYLLNLVVKEEDYRTVFFSSYSEAFDFLIKKECSLIVVNLGKVNTSDIEFIEKIREIDTSEQISIIVASTENSFKQISKCLKSGASDFISKPFNIESLKNKIKLVLNETKIISL